MHTEETRHILALPSPRDVCSMLRMTSVKRCNTCMFLLLTSFLSWNAWMSSFAILNFMKRCRNIEFSATIIVQIIAIWPLQSFFLAITDHPVSSLSLYVCLINEIYLIIIIFVVRKYNSSSTCTDSLHYSCRVFATSEPRPYSRSVLSILDLRFNLTYPIDLNIDIILSKNNIKDNILKWHIMDNKYKDNKYKSKKLKFKLYLMYYWNNIHFLVYYVKCTKTESATRILWRFLEAALRRVVHWNEGFLFVVVEEMVSFLMISFS